MSLLSKEPSFTEDGKPTLQQGPLWDVQEEPVEQELLTVKNTPNAKKWKCIRIGSAVGIVLGLILIFAVPSLLDELVVSLTIDHQILSPTNEGVWAHFPGDSGVIIFRNFTFFTLQNEDDFLIRRSPPRLHEVKGYAVQELEDFINITYNEEGSRASFIDWLRFVSVQDSRPLNESLRVLNLATVGYWFNFKAARPAQLLIQGLALLLTNLQDALLDSVLAQGISAQFLPDYSSASLLLFTPLSLSSALSKALWNDSLYGMSNSNNLLTWIHATRSPSCSEAMLLRNHFSLSSSQLQFFIDKFKTFSSTMDSILLRNHYCENELDQCTGRHLAVRQLARSEITGFPPPVPSALPADSICSSNSTCNGYYPQLNAFWLNIYRKKHPSHPQFHVDSQLVASWFQHNLSDGSYCKSQNCLLHLGNLDALLSNFSHFKQNGNQQSLQNIANRLGLNSVAQAQVVGEWLEYFLQEFMKRGQSTERLGIATLFSQGLFTAFEALRTTLPSFILRSLLLLQQPSDCVSFLTVSLDNSQVANAFCATVNKESFVLALFDACESESPPWTLLRKQGASLPQLTQLCDPLQQQGFGALIHKVRSRIAEHYNCSTVYSEYCSDVELALKQWADSTVTLFPLPQLSEKLNPSATASSWLTLPAFQYGFFRSKLTSSEQETLPKLSEEAKELLSFEGWFSSGVVLQKWSGFGQSLRNYLRFIILNVRLGGLTTQRTAQQLIFGYEDQLLKEIKEGYPPFGGDPSTQSVIALNDPNITLQQTWLKMTLDTGSEDYTNVYRYTEIDGVNYLSHRKLLFNGNETEEKQVALWKEKDMFYGTSGKLMAPNMFEANNISLYIPNLQRYGSGALTDCVEKEANGWSVFECYIGNAQPRR